MEARCVNLVSSNVTRNKLKLQKQLKFYMLFFPFPSVSREVPYHARCFNKKLWNQCHITWLALITWLKWEWDGSSWRSGNGTICSWYEQRRIRGNSYIYNTTNYIKFRDISVAKVLGIFCSDKLHNVWIYYKHPVSELIKDLNLILMQTFVFILTSSSS